MNTVTLDVQSLSQSLSDAAHAMQSGHASPEARISFASPELLWRVLTTKRWALLKALCGAGPMSVREAARRCQRDVKAVHSDITALRHAGLLTRTPDGQIEFPYDAVKVEFLLEAA